MHCRYKIGVDIGGTHTDGVIIDENSRIIAFAKSLTTLNVEQGFQQVIQMLLHKSQLLPQQIADVSLGTTHATNAILERRGLYHVGVIRIAGHQPESIPPCFLWPEDLKKEIFAGVSYIGGGYECDGTPLTSFEPKQVQQELLKLKNLGAESLAVVGVFSPLNPQHENEVQNLAQETLGTDFPISLSHRIGGIGFIERENSTILNAALKRFMKNGFSQLKKTMQDLQMHCPLWITQNNGSRMPLEQATDYPVLTISAGPTNSFIGGAKLAFQEEAIVVDIGGTSTDVGVVRAGYPRRRLNKSKIGGISLNFSMPDVLSIALGGGSHIQLGKNLTIGPLSSGRETFSQGISFGGDQLTLTDVALTLGYISIPGASRIPLSVNDCMPVFEKAKTEIQYLVESIGIDEQHLPVIMIGGGSSLFQYSTWGERYHHPEYSHVANAYGAALAEFSATVDSVVIMTHREKALTEIEEKVLTLAVEQGACPKKVKIVDRQIIPYHYASQPMARVVITASG